eukprot:2948464-Rhodomonas_salina.1
MPALSPETEQKGPNASMNVRVAPEKVRNASRNASSFANNVSTGGKNGGVPAPVAISSPGSTIPHVSTGHRIDDA